MKKTAQAARIKHILGRGSPCKRDYGVRQEVLKDEVEMRTQVSLVCWSSMGPWQNYHKGYEGKRWLINKKSLPEKMEAWNSSNILEHEKQVLLVHHLPCRNHLYSTWEEDTNLPHLWHRNNGKAFFETGSACFQLLLSFGPEVCRLKAFLNFLMVLTRRCWFENSQEKPDNNLHPHETQSKGNSKDLMGPDAFMTSTFSLKTWMSQQAFKVFAGGQDPNPKKH